MINPDEDKPMFVAMIENFEETIETGDVYTDEKTGKKFIPMLRVYVSEDGSSMFTSSPLDEYEEKQILQQIYDVYCKPFQLQMKSGLITNKG